MKQTHTWKRRTNARGEIRLFGKTFDMSTGTGAPVKISVTVDIPDTNEKPCRKWYVGQMLERIGAKEATSKSRVLS